MELVDTLTLEDNETYIVTDEILIDNIKYVYLVKENNMNKFCIRKVNIINGSEYLVNLDNDEEFTKAMNEYRKKNDVI